MSNRTYLVLTSALAVAGGFVVVATFAFSEPVAASIALGIGIGACVGSIATLAVVPASHALRSRALAIVSAVAAACTLIAAAGVFAGDAQRWIVFAGGVAVTLLALAGRDAYVAGLVEPAADAPDRISGREDTLRAAA
jgi:hypothetical protein